MLVAAAYYSRLRFISNLLPLIRTAPSLRRVVTVAGGGNEGPIDPTDFPALHVPLRKIRGHICSLITLSLESMVKIAPEVSFIHDYPGTVVTPLFDHAPRIVRVLTKMYVCLLGRWICIPIEECGERHVFLATNEQFPPATGIKDVLRLRDASDVALGTTGEIGSGVYSVGWNCESAPSSVVELLDSFRKEGMVEQVWEHTAAEFRRITGPEGED